MKRKLTYMLVILAALCLVWAGALAGEEDWVFDLEEGTDGYKILDYKGTDLDVTVPDTYKGKPVVAIALESFAGKTAQIVRIPSSVKRIGESAFEMCPNLTAVLPAGNGEINVPVINQSSFAYCKKLSNISALLKHAGAINKKAFFSCSSLTSVTIPKNVTAIGELAFASCTGLTEITILNPGLTFGANVFKEDSKLTVHGYKGSTAETYAGEYGIPFEALKWVISFNAGGGSGQMADQSVSIGEKYTLPPCAFTAPAGKVFSSWDKGAPGTEIEISEDTVITALWKDLTAGGLKYTLSGSQAIVTGPKDRNAKKVTIPDKVKVGKKSYKVTVIRSGAFKGMTRLTTVTIGANVKAIGKNAFRNCAKLKNITIKTTKLSYGNVKANAFRGISKTATFKLPKNKRDVYKKLLLKRGAPKTCRFK